MKRKFIIDKEIDLNEYDFLKTKPYAKNLEKIIKNTEPNKVFTVGLFGHWGSGKSSIVETSKTEFDQNKVKFITYDAWQYSNDSFRRMFLRKIKDELKFEETQLMQNFYHHESMDVGNKYQFSPTRLAFILVGLAITLGIIRILPFEIENKTPLYSLITLIGLIISIISGAFHQLKISVTKPLFFAPEQFEDCFKQMISKSLKHYDWKQILNYTIKGDKTVIGLDKIVIVIDNIDRCNSEVAYNLLTDIKTFLGSEAYSIVFVIPVDDEALRKHLLSSKKNSHDDEDCDKEKEEFLRKFFNVTIRIKPYRDTDMFYFGTQINDKFALKFNKETINLASKEYSTNPRRVIQLFNNLISELSNYDLDFSSKYETLICSVIIMREEFGTYYKKVLNAPKIYIEGIISDDPKDEHINRFIRISRTATKDVDSVSLGRVLTNSENIFSDLSSDAKDAIETFNINVVLDLMLAEPHRTDIFDYMCHKISQAIGNGLKNDVVQYFDMVAKINISYKIDHSLNLRLNECFWPEIDYIIENCKNYENVCNYANQQLISGDKNLKEKLVYKISSTDGKASYIKPLFNVVLDVFSDKKTATDLSVFFTQCPDLRDASKEFSTEQYNFLISDTFLAHRIDELDINDGLDDIDDENYTSNKYDKLLQIFSNKKNITSKNYNSIIKRLIDLAGIMDGKTKEQIATVLENFLPWLRTIPNEKLKNNQEQLIKLYAFIYAVRSIPNPLYAQNAYNNAPRQINLNFFDECISNKVFIADIVEFEMTIYKLTLNSSPIIDHIVLLAQNHRGLLNLSFARFLNSNISIDPFIPIIFNDHEYIDNNSVLLTKHCFEINIKTKGLIITKDQLSAKIDELLAFVQEIESLEMIAFIDTLVDEPIYAEIIVRLILTKETSFINKLSSKLLQLAVKSFTKDNSESFYLNFNFLQIIAERGDKNQIEYLIRIINKKLESNDSIIEIVTIIKLVNAYKTTSKDKLVAGMKHYLEEFKDDIDNSVRDDIRIIIKSFDKEIKSLKK